MQLKIKDKNNTSLVSGNLPITRMNFTQPKHMLSNKEKDDTWVAQTMDWYEEQGLVMIKANLKNKLKNYRLANGIIDKSDYIPEYNEFDDTNNLINILSKENDVVASSELNFYPIIPNVIDLLTGEMAKRTSKVIPFATDPISKSEKLEKKKELIDSILIKEAQENLYNYLVENGVDPNSEEFNTQLSPENIKTLPEVEEFISKNYKITIESWSGHQINVDTQRFRVEELEIEAFRDLLTVYEEFWHVKMLENDYKLELWNPAYTFYHLSPGQNYVSNANFAGHVELMTPMDAINTYGYLLTEDEIADLQSCVISSNTSFLLNGPNDGRYYDVTKTPEQNLNNGSLAYNQFMAFERAFPSNNSSGDFEAALTETRGDAIFQKDLVRVTTCYFKSLRKLKLITQIDFDGALSTEIVDGEYTPIFAPVYDTSFFKEKSAKTLIFGEHEETLWIPESWGGIKISLNGLPTGVVGNKGAGLSGNPIYLGIGGNKKPSRLPYQFKGENDLFGCKLPIEGGVFGRRNAQTMSVVDRMKPHQLGFNIVNNQIQDILIDELGTVAVIDHNTLPKHSMNEEWGPNNLAKAYVAMKNFQMLPLDYSLENMEAPSRFSNLTSLDLSQTQRLLSRINLANYFKNEAFMSIGVSPERLGSVVGQNTATGIEQAVTNSYAQTEKYFIQHSDWLMPRVYEMLLNAAQFYLTLTPSNQLSYVTTKGEQVIFNFNPADISIPRDINVFCTTAFKARELKKKLEQLAISNNTSGASIYDLGKMFYLETPSELLASLEQIERKATAIRQQESENIANLEKQRIEAEMAEKEREREFTSQENEKNRQTRILERQIQAAGYAAQRDYDKNQQNDYLDTLSVIKKDEQYNNMMGLQREKEINKNNISKQQLQFKKDELATKREIATKNLQIAKENKNKYDKK